MLKSSKQAQSQAAVEVTIASQNDGAASAAALGGDDPTPFPWSAIRKSPRVRRETAREKRQRLEAEREAEQQAIAASKMASLVGLARACTHKRLDDMRCCEVCGEYIAETGS